MTLRNFPTSFFLFKNLRNFSVLSRWRSSRTVKRITPTWRSGNIPLP